VRLNEQCPLCATDGKKLFRRHGFWIIECLICTHRWAKGGLPDKHVLTVYGDSYFQGGGAGYPDYIGEGPLLRAHGQRYGRLLKGYAPIGTVLDVGAAAGFVLQGFQDEGWKTRGIEPNTSMAVFANEQLGIDVTAGSFEEYSTGELFDLVSMIQILPHFQDPKNAIGQAARLTKAGGHLLIETWNRRSLTAIVCGRRWHEYSPPSVLHWFTPDSVRSLAEEFGYVEIATGRPKKRLSGAHMKSLLMFKLEGTSLRRSVCALISMIPDRLTLPYPAEDLFWSLFQLSDFKKTE
jgi:SAM-dependent methyltransferase